MYKYFVDWRDSPEVKITFCLSWAYDFSSQNSAQSSITMGNWSWSRICRRLLTLLGTFSHFEYTHKDAYKYTLVNIINILYLLYKIYISYIYMIYRKYISFENRYIWKIDFFFKIIKDSSQWGGLLDKGTRHLAQWLGLDLRFHFGEGDNLLSQVVLRSPQAGHFEHGPLHIQGHKNPFYF